VLQSLAFAAFIGCAVVHVRWPHGARPWLPIAGGVIALAGLALLVDGRRSLGSSFTTLPRPRSGGELRLDGAYRLVRHPIYGGLLLLGVGLSLVRSPLLFAPTAALALIFTLKSLREEAWLAQAYPGYAAYRARTRHRFVPWLL